MKKKSSFGTNCPEAWVLCILIDFLVKSILCLILINLLVSLIATHFADSILQHCILLI